MKYIHIHDWKVDNISKLLKGCNLIIYVNDFINYKNYIYITKVLFDKFTNINIAKFPEFPNLKIENT